MNNFRTCTKCGEEKPLTTEYFYKVRHQRGGMSTRCIACKKLNDIATKEQRKAWTRKNRDKINRQMKEWRTNRTPEQVAEASRIRAERYYANHEESKRKSNEWYAANADKINSKRQERYKNDPILRAKAAANKKRYYEEHGDKLRAKARERHYTPRGRWLDIHNTANRRGIAWKLPFEYYEKEVWGKNCHYCGGLNTSNGVDRMDNNGGYTIDNIVPSCHLCNTRKSDVPYEVYLNRINDVDVEKYNRLNNVMKECTACGESKLRVSENFYSLTKSLDTYSYKTFQPECRTCHNMRTRTNYKANKEAIAKREKAYYKANKEAIAKKAKARYEANKERILEQQKEYSQRKKNFAEINKEKDLIT
jgi:hypothetical protein